jgi:hypothetical protein
MKKLNILKTLLDIFWYSSLLFLLILIFFLPFYLFASDTDFTVKIRGQEINSKPIFSRIIVFVNVISGLLFINGIYLLRKLVVLFQKREIFNAEIVRLFNLIGKLIIGSSIISSFSLYVYNKVEGNHSSLSFDFGSYDSLLISVSLGLFFMVISEVFKIANTIKEENDLTV